MIYIASWLSNDTQLLKLRAQHNEALAARYYAHLGPVRLALNHLTSMLRRGWQLWRSDARKRTAIAELSGLDDRLLKDIGVARSQIPGLARAGLSKNASNAVHSKLVDTPPAIKLKPQTIAQPIPRPECQIIPLLPTAHEDGIPRTKHGEELAHRLPLNAA